MRIKTEFAQKMPVEYEEKMCDSGFVGFQKVTYVSLLEV
jgi:hypothetical protein